MQPIAYIAPEAPGPYGALVFLNADATDQAHEMARARMGEVRASFENDGVRWTSYELELYSPGDERPRKDLRPQHVVAWFKAHEWDLRPYRGEHALVVGS